MWVSLIATAALLAAGDPDEAMATAPETPVTLDVAAAPAAPSVEGAAQEAAPHGLTTDQQIERWLESRDPAATPFAGEAAMIDDREPHGEFSVSVGTGGYRDYGAAVSLPLGETGRLDLSYRQVENGYYGYGWGDPWFDDSGYVFPGRQAGAAAAFEWRAARPEGPPQYRPTARPLRAMP